MQLYEKDVLRMCYVYLHDLPLAEDAAQETFLKAYRAMDRFRGDSSEKTWLMRIAINTCKDIRRAAWFRHTERRVSLEDLPQPAEPPKADSVLITLEVMRLPPKEREAVLLRYYQNMTLAETARALGISAGAVSKRLRKAHQRLEPALKGGDGDA
jgi:RNA polymerase sigma-70 factor (ECF subfamily)